MRYHCCDHQTERFCVVHFKNKLQLIELIKEMKIPACPGSSSVFAENLCLIYTGEVSIRNMFSVQHSINNAISSLFLFWF